ncbi:ASCH domain-containing protein [Streptomyces sp. NBC_00335]|uniref:ASCH domain-containing protein n=1 Tax=unclassified Streptomyces TaxID=2593676 RepID=UPI002259D8ED|nr:MULTISPECIES: ASCH domain-containing protein [unclassified Streptomyces]MCX5408294.1 ASCH domain-containing protein [Streptomyces sp. NBC_00086]
MTAYEDLPPIEFAFPGPLRDLLVAAVLSGAKTTTTGVLADYEAAGDPLPVAGEMMVIVDSAERPVGVLEVTDVQVLRLADVGLRHALDEGEGFTSVAEWRSGHEEFWHGPQMREAIGDPHFTVDDDTPVVAERFRLVTRLPLP